MTTELLMVTMLQSVLSVLNDLQRTYIQIKNLQVPRNRQGRLSGNCRTLYSLCRIMSIRLGTMVLMEEEDVLPPSPLYFPHSVEPFSIRHCRISSAINLLTLILQLLVSGSRSSRLQSLNGKIHKR